MNENLRVLIVSFHEAGHVVVGCALGLNIVEATIFGVSGAPGGITAAALPSSGDELLQRLQLGQYTLDDCQLVRDFAVYAFAGEAGEIFGTGRRPPQGALDGDWEAVKPFIELLTEDGDDRADFVARLKVEAERRVRENSELVMVVANELARSRKLSIGEIRQLCHGVRR